MKKESVFSFFTKVFMTYGLTIFIINIMCLVVGEGAREYSTMFSLGSQGLSVATQMRFLALCFIITLLRFVFFTDAVIKNWHTPARVAAMFAALIAVMVAFIIIFRWFPVDDALAWLLFLVCFAVSTALSTVISLAKEKSENRKLEEALMRIKGENDE